MNKDKIISKWLNGENLPDEEKAFFDQVDSAMKSMKAPEFDTSGEYDRLNAKLAKSTKSTSRVIPMYPRMGLAVAAAIALLLTFYFLFFQPSQRIFETGVAETLEVYLPDSSLVIMNASSRLTFDNSTWENKREVQLEGEAYFEVEKGSKFSVIGSEWEVNVLGTSFNILDREDIFLVKCFEGRVAVNSAIRKEELTAGKEYRLFGDTQLSRNFYTQEERPSWVTGNLEYESMPIEFVINELERNYEIEVISENLNTSREFTGGFSRYDLQSALKTLSLSTGCSFEMRDQKQVVLKCENP